MPARHYSADCALFFGAPGNRALSELSYATRDLCRLAPRRNLLTEAETLSARLNPVQKTAIVKDVPFTRI